MSILSFIPIVGKVIDGVTKVVDQAVEDKDLANKLKTDLQTRLSTMDYSFLEKEIESKAKIITAEAQGDSWLQRNWRPVLMLTFTYIIAHNYIISPILAMFVDGVPVLEIPPDMWDLLKLGIGGYIAGRSGEKIVKVWKGKNGD